MIVIANYHFSDETDSLPYPCCTDSPCTRASQTTAGLVPQSSATSIGLRSFRSSVLTAWNDMPAHLHSDLALNDFRQLLRTALFRTVSV